jgi:hypothetical protein
LTPNQKVVKVMLLSWALACSRKISYSLAILIIEQFDRNIYIITKATRAAFEGEKLPIYKADKKNKAA